MIRPHLIRVCPVSSALSVPILRIFTVCKEFYFYIYTKHVFYKGLHFNIHMVTIKLSTFESSFPCKSQNLKVDGVFDFLTGGLSLWSTLTAKETTQYRHTTFIQEYRETSFITRTKTWLSHINKEQVCLMLTKNMAVLCIQRAWLPHVNKDLCRLMLTKNLAVSC